MCGGHGRSVFAAACLAVSRYFATAGLRSAALHTCVKGSAQAVKPDVCRCAALKTKSSHRTPSALRCACSPWAEGEVVRKEERGDAFRSLLGHLPPHHQQSAGSETFSAH